MIADKCISKNVFHSKFKTFGFNLNPLISNAQTVYCRLIDLAIKTRHLVIKTNILSSNTHTILTL